MLEKENRGPFTSRKISFSAQAATGSLQLGRICILHRPDPSDFCALVGGVGTIRGRRRKHTFGSWQVAV